MAVWRDVPGLPGIKASDDCQILNSVKERIKTQRPGSNGAMQVVVNGITYMVHDLVARAFYGRPPCKGYRVKHLNKNRGDNRPANLVWSGSPPPDYGQSPSFTEEFEQEYDRIRLERLSIVDLMQS